MAFATPTYEKEYSTEKGHLTLKIWIPPMGKVMRVPTAQKSVSMPVAHPAFYIGQVAKGGTVYRTLYPYEIERYFCGIKDLWKEGLDFWEELKARELI